MSSLDAFPRGPICPIDFEAKRQVILTVHLYSGKAHWSANHRTL